MVRQIGIFSGSFDPVHTGHIAFAKEAARVCNLETVIFMPERFPRGKPNVSPISERVTELEIALAGTPFEVLNAHTDQFTVNKTLPELEALYPGADFTFLVGSDVALNLPNWQDTGYLIDRYDFAVGMRQDSLKAAVEATMKNVQARYVLVTTPYGHISSRTLR